MGNVNLTDMHIMAVSEGERKGVRKFTQINNV